MVAVDLVYTKPSSPMYFWELAFDDIMTGEVMGDCTLNSNPDGLEAAVNHRVE